jgi:hypothetical protein
MARKNKQSANGPNPRDYSRQVSVGHGDLDQGVVALKAFTILEHMEVMASCGTRVGKVDKVEGKSLKLTKNDPQAGGKHHYIPLAWVARVDQQVHLNKDSEDVMRDWQDELTGTTAGTAHP